MTPPDLDALEKLADEAMNELKRFAFDAAPMESAKDRAAARKVMRKADTTIKALIAELKEARVLLQGMCDAYEIVCDDSGMRYHLSATSKYAVSRAFLARNGKGEG